MKDLVVKGMGISEEERRKKIRRTEREKGDIGEKERAVSKKTKEKSRLKNME